MNFVKKNGFEAQLAGEMQEANQMLSRLKRLERIRHEILELKQSTVAEIRSYSKPPLVVHTVMTVTLLILGHKEKDTKVRTYTLVDVVILILISLKCISDRQFNAIQHVQIIIQD